MTILRTFRAWGLICWALFFFPLIARAQQDITITGGSGANPFIIIGRSISWAGSGPGNLNNNFIFSPVDPNQGFCLFISNNNPTNSHTVSVTVSQTGDPSLQQFIGFAQKWNTVPTITSFPVTVAASGIQGINYKTTASANIRVGFTGATAQAGTPDTADVFAVQTNQSACGSLSTQAVQGPFQQGTNVTLANQFPVLVGGLASPGSTGSALAMHLGTTGNGLLLDGGICCQSWASGFITPSNIASSTFSKVQASPSASQQGEMILNTIPIASIGNKGWAAGLVHTNFMEVATDQQYLAASGTPAFQVLGTFTNPGAGATILHNFDKVNSVVNPAYKTLVVSCSVACELLINRTSTQGTTCTALTIRNLQLGNANTVQAANANDVAENNCTGGAPTSTFTMFDLSLAAGIPQTIDLSGYVNFHSATTGAGIDVINVANIAAGLVTATLSFMEQ
jgi:hypothetical protein